MGRRRANGTELNQQSGDAEAGIGLETSGLATQGAALDIQGTWACPLLLLTASESEVTLRNS